MAPPEYPLAGLAHDRKGLGQQVIERGALGVPTAEFVGFGRQLRIGERGDLWFQRVDLGYQLAILLKQPVVTAAYEFFEQRNHACRWRHRRRPPPDGPDSARGGLLFG